MKLKKLLTKIEPPDTRVILCTGNYAEDIQYAGEVWNAPLYTLGSRRVKSIVPTICDDTQRPGLQIMVEELPAGDEVEE